MGFNLSLQQLDNYKPSANSKSYYTGPTTFEGYKINQEHSPRKFIRSVHAYLKATQFAAINLIGNMGTGKTTTANMLAHLWHEELPETKITWAGSDELKNITGFLEGLEQGIDHLIIFDDSSNILDTLSGEQVSEAFNSYTKARHTTKSRLGIILIYHYTYSMKKNFRSSSTFTIYSSSTLTEQANIIQTLGKNPRSIKVFKDFVKIYNQAYTHDPGIFEVDIGTGTKVPFTRDDPFRCVFVITDFAVNLMMVKQMSCNHCAIKQSSNKVDPQVIFDMVKKTHPKYAPLALGLVCYHKGHKMAIPKELRRVLNFALDFLKDNATDYDKLTDIIRASRKIPNTRDYRNRKAEEQLRRDILEATKNPQPEEPQKDIDISDPFGEKSNDDLSEFNPDDEEEF